jgi:hypothetical protein
MIEPLNNPKVVAALQRAGMPTPSVDVIDRLAWAFTALRDGPDPDGVLEISQAEWATEEQGTDVVVIQLRDAVLLIGKGKRGRFKPMEHFAIRAPYDYSQDLAEDDEIAGASVFFLPKVGHKPFLLSFANAHERHRMFRCLFEAHAGSFSRWGLQLDPANYVTDFDRYYAELRTNGPSDPDGWNDWVEQQYGDFDRTNALGLAAEWRENELLDQRGLYTRQARLGSVTSSSWRVDRHPEARRVIVKLGEQLYDEGLLNPPYDERTSETSEGPLRSAEPGPSRLIALMTLAAYAHAMADPRATEWLAAAQAGIPSLPADAFPPAVRQMWAGVGGMPVIPEPDDCPAPEIPIWNDVDVREISLRDDAGNHHGYTVDMLTPSDRSFVTDFLDAAVMAEHSEEASEEEVTRLCLKGVSTFENLSPLAPAGWRKFVLYVVSDQTYRLWENHRAADPAAKLAHWVVATIEANRWGPDGRSSPLGQHHSYAMGVAISAGAGVIEFDPTTGEAKPRTGDEARRAAADGSFSANQTRNGEMK